MTERTICLHWLENYENQRHFVRDLVVSEVAT